MKLDKSILEEFKDYYNLNDSQLSMVEKGFYSFLELHIGSHSHSHSSHSSCSSSSCSSSSCSSSSCSS
jgi:hypothetical protein